MRQDTAHPASETMDESAESVYRLFLVAGAHLYRDCLTRLLGQNGAISVVGGASTTTNALSQVAKLRPDIVLLDARTTRSQEFARGLRSTTLRAKVVVIAIEETPAAVLEWVEAGVAGFVSERQSFDHLIHAITSVGSGEFDCSPRIGALLLQSVGSLAAQVHGAPSDLTNRISLSAREREIIDLIGRGLSNKRIASELGISVATAKNHVHNILSKLQLRRRTEAAALLSCTPTRRSTK